MRALTQESEGHGTKRRQKDPEEVDPSNPGQVHVLAEEGPADEDGQVDDPEDLETKGRGFKSSYLTIFN